MFADYFSQDLKAGEKVIKILHRHPASFIWPASKTFFILLLPCFFISFLFSSLPGVIIFLVWLAVGLGYGIHQWIEWYLDLFVLTNQRIINIDQKGLFSRQVSELGYKGVQRVTYRISGFWATAFGFGDVILKSAESEQEIIIKATPEPHKVQELIVDIQKKQGISAQELVDLIAQTKGKNETVHSSSDAELSVAHPPKKN